MNYLYGMEKSRPIFHRRIFWDVDFDKLDYDLRYKFVIERVFERGDVEDIRQCRRYYGDDKVKAVLVQAKWLPLKSIYLACALFENSPEDYRCYILAQSNPLHFQY